jgi:hypothetical protein
MNTRHERRRYRRTVLGVAVVVCAMMTTTLIGLAGAPAASAQGTAPCPSNYYCFYEGVGYVGWHLNYNSTTRGSFNKPPFSDGDKRNELSSIINNGNRTICVWDDWFVFNKLLVQVAPHQDYKNLDEMGAGDKADSWTVYLGNKSC